MTDYRTTIDGIILRFDGFITFRRPDVLFPGAERQITHLGQLTDLFDAVPGDLYLDLYGIRLGEGVTVENLKEPVNVRTFKDPMPFQVLAFVKRDGGQIDFVRSLNLCGDGSTTVNLKDLVEYGVLPRDDGTYSGWAMCVAEPVPGVWKDISKRSYE